MKRTAVRSRRRPCAGSRVDGRAMGSPGCCSIDGAQRKTHSDRRGSLSALIDVNAYAPARWRMSGSHPISHRAAWLSTADAPLVLCSIGSSFHGDGAGVGPPVLMSQTENASRRRRRYYRLCHRAADSGRREPAALLTSSSSAFLSIRIRPPARSEWMQPAMRYCRSMETQQPHCTETRLPHRRRAE
jgi:hypothetical protein